jgi:pilus assembly protein CpaD
MAHSHTLGRRLAATVAVGALAATLAGCQSSRGVSSSAYPADFRDRHPIVLADGPRVLDLFVEGSRGLSGREEADLGAYLAEHRRHGHGPISVQVPTRVAHGPAVRATVARIRSAAGGRVVLSSYQPADPALASPVRLSFPRLQAKVGSQCGLWPQDLGVGDAEFSTSNRPYWNLGCATQSNFASQIAEPTDLVRGRQPTAPDTGRRMYNIEQLRRGQDPSTNWKTESTTVRQGVSQ